MKRKWWMILAVAGVVAAGWLLLGEPSRVLIRIDVPSARPLGTAPDGRLAVLTQTELLMIDSQGEVEKNSNLATLAQASYPHVADRDGFTVTAQRDGVIRRFNWQGKHLWTFTAPAAVSRPVASTEGSIYVAIRGKGLLALNLDGSPRWTNSRVIPNWPMVDSPTVGADGRVAMASATDGLVVYDREGRLLWRNSAPLYPHENPGLVFAPNLDLVATHRLEMRRFDAAGELQWYINLREFPVVGGIPLINGLPIFASDGTLYCVADERVFAISAKGERLWEHRMNTVPSNNRWVSFLGQRWGAVTPNGDVLFLAGDREMRQTPAGPGSPFSMQMHVRNERIVCLRPDGTLKWEQPVASPLTLRVPKSKRELQSLWASRFRLRSANDFYGFLSGTNDQITFFGWANGKTRIWVIRGE